MNGAQASCDRPTRGVQMGLLGGLLLASLWVYSALVDRQPTGWDALGYQVAARSIVQGLGPAIEHPLNQTLGPYFTLSAFANPSAHRPARLYLNYPPGFSLFLAIPQWLGLPDFLTLPILGMLGVLFTYKLGCLLFDRWTGLLGAALVAFTPAYVEWSTALWADLPGTCCMWGALATYLAAQHQAGRVGRIAFGAASGALVAAAVFIKYSHLLVVLPLLAYAIVRQRGAMFHSGINWVLAMVVAAGLGGVGLYNQAVYGSPFETHYTAGRSGYHFAYFSLAYAVGPSPAGGYSLPGAVETLWGNFSWLLVPAALGLAKGTRAAAAMLGGMFLVFMGLSSIFAWAPVQVDTRYMLPVFAPVGLFAAHGCLSRLDRLAAGRRWLTPLVLIAAGLTMGWLLSGAWPRLAQRNADSLSIQKAAQDLTAGSEPDAIFLAYMWNDPIYFWGRRTTLFYRRIPFTDRARFASTLTGVVADLLRAGRPVYYVLDSQPPLANSLQILQQNFDLQVWKERSLPVYRVALKE